MGIFPEKMGIVHMLVYRTAVDSISIEMIKTVCVHIFFREVSFVLKRT